MTACTANMSKADKRPFWTKSHVRASACLKHFGVPQDGHNIYVHEHNPALSSPAKSGDCPQILLTHLHCAHVDRAQVAAKMTSEIVVTASVTKIEQWADLRVYL